MEKRATPYSLCATAMATSGLVLGATPAYASITSTPGYFQLANAGQLVSIAAAMAACMRR